MELIALTDAGAGVALAQYEFPATDNDYAGVLRAQLPSGEWADSEMWLVDATYTRAFLAQKDPATCGADYWAQVGTNGHSVYQDTDGEHIEIDGTLYLIEWRDYSGPGEVA